MNCTRVSAGPEKTPDYMLVLGTTSVAVEIKQIESMEGFNRGGVSSRTVGKHVRNQITEARKQLQSAARFGLPAILLVHNTVDPVQLFGTEQHDFICAMYGELTVSIRKCDGAVGETFQGRNAKLRHDTNTSFSGVGHLRQLRNGAAITVYENVYAAHPLPFQEIPPCIEVVRVKVEHA